MNWYMLGLVVVLMGLTGQRFIKAVRSNTGDADRDHCERVFAILVVALAVVLTHACAGG